MAEVIEFPIDYILCCCKCRSNYMLIYLNSKDPNDFAYTKCADCGNIEDINENSEIKAAEK